MKATNRPTIDPDTENTEPEGRYVVDRLGKMDLDGWELADKVIGRYGSMKHGKHTMFNDLKGLSFGVWDDGRWNVYEDRERQCRRREGQGMPNEDICPVGYVKDILSQVFTGFNIKQAFNVCHYVGTGVADPYAAIIYTTSCGRRIIHEKADCRLPHLSGPTRIYVKVDARSNYSAPESNLRRSISHLFKISDAKRSGAPQSDRQRRLDTVRAKRSNKIQLELCFLPAEAGNDTHIQKSSGDQGDDGGISRKGGKDEPFRKGLLGQTRISSRRRSTSLSMLRVEGIGHTRVVVEW
jgi:hypothetical protein